DDFRRGKNEAGPDLKAGRVVDPPIELPGCAKAGQRPALPPRLAGARRYVPRMLKAPRFLACFLPVLALRSAPPAQPAELLNGHDLAGWEYVNPEKVAPDGVFHWTSEGALAVAGKPVGYLATTASYENYRFHAEWRWPANAAKNS